MTNEKKDLLIAYLTRSSSMPPESRRGVSRKDAGLASPRARRSWAGTSWRAARAFTTSRTMPTGGRINPRDPASESPWRPQAGQFRRGYAHDGLRVISPKTSRLWPFWQERTGLDVERRHDHQHQPHRGHLPGRPRAPGRRAGEARPGKDPERGREGLGGDEARHRRPHPGPDRGRAGADARNRGWTAHPGIPGPANPQRPPAPALLCPPGRAPRPVFLQRPVRSPGRHRPLGPPDQGGLAKRSRSRP